MSLTQERDEGTRVKYGHELSKFLQTSFGRTETRKTSVISSKRRNCVYMELRYIRQREALHRPHGQRQNQWARIVWTPTDRRIPRALILRASGSFQILVRNVLRLRCFNVAISHGVIPLRSDRSEILLIGLVFRKGLVLILRKFVLCSRAGTLVKPLSTAGLDNVENIGAEICLRQRFRAKQFVGF
jgi:hypothetical protein